MGICHSNVPQLKTSLEASPTVSKKEFSRAQHTWQDIPDLRDWNNQGLARFPILDFLSSRRSMFREGLKRLEQDFKRDIEQWNKKLKSN